MKHTAFALLALIGTVGCGPMADDRPLPTGPAPQAKPTNGPTTSPPAAPDNTRINERDRLPDAKTPINQDENKGDIQITADIRKTILATDGMSVNAQNSKIITSGGKVTLRGPVASAEEKAKVERIAVDVAGEGNVKNELEIAE
jgi:hyperosmotically inducible periplasmic protein